MQFNFILAQFDLIRETLIKLDCHIVFFFIDLQVWLEYTKLYSGQGWGRRN